MGRDADRGREANHGASAAEVRAPGDGALSASPVLRSLLHGAIDYAGLFPPAALSMADAVEEYRNHLRARDRWALGRFVVPLTRMDELVACRSDRPGGDVDAWPTSVLAAPSDVDAIRRLLPGRGGPVCVEAIECRAAVLQDVRDAAALVGLGVDVFVEASLPPGELPDYAAALRQVGAAGKIRTGGVTSDAFPDARYLLGFMRACRGASVRFKATAGLHHAVRGDYALTYDPGSTKGLMFGFLNVAVAAVFVWVGHGDDQVMGVLEERDSRAFEFTGAGVSWRGAHVTRQEIEDARSGFFAGFGSCSFREPMVELGLEAVPAP